MNLDQTVIMEYWDTHKNGTFFSDANLKDLVVHIPDGFSLAYLGFYLLNEIRKDMNLEPLPKKRAFPNYG